MLERRGQCSGYYIRKAYLRPGSMPGLDRNGIFGYNNINLLPIKLFSYMFFRLSIRSCRT